MRSHTEAHLPGRCKRCYQKERLCLCALVPEVETSADFLLIRHAWEAAKSTNTARYTQLALKRCTLLDFDPERPEELGPLGALDNACLLFPEGSTEPPPGVNKVVVLDGTWRQARKMIKRLPALWKLPRWSIPAPAVERKRLRYSARAENMSTLEAVAAAVELLDGAEKGGALLDFHELVVERTLIGRGAIPYPEEFKRNRLARRSGGATE